MSLSASAVVAGEGETLTVSAILNSAAPRNLRVPVVLDGTAKSRDRTRLTNIRIAKGQSSGQAALRIKHDTLDEREERVTVTLGSRLPRGVTAASPETVSVAIRDDDPTTVKLRRVGSAEVLSENGGGSARLRLRIGRELQAGEELVVPLIVTGAGVTDDDYRLRLGSMNGPGVSFDAATSTVTITGGPGMKRSVNLRLSPLDDTVYEGPETVLISLPASDSSSPALGTRGLGGGATGTGSVSVEIGQGDDELRPQPVAVTLQREGSASTLYEEFPSQGRLRLSTDRSLVSGETLVVPLVAAGTAVVGTDYRLELEGSPSGVSFDAATRTVTITGGSNVERHVYLRISAVDDKVHEATETIDVSVPATTSGVPALTAQGISGGAAGSGSAGFSIWRGDDPDKQSPISLTLQEVFGSGMHESMGRAILRLRLSRVLRYGESLVVPLLIGGSGVTAGDYSLRVVTGTVTDAGDRLTTDPSPPPGVAFDGARQSVIIRSTPKAGKDVYIELFAVNEGVTEDTEVFEVTIPENPSSTPAVKVSGFAGDVIGRGGARIVVRDFSTWTGVAPQAPFLRWYCEDQTGEEDAVVGCYLAHEALSGVPVTVTGVMRAVTDEDDFDDEFHELYYDRATGGTSCGPGVDFTTASGMSVTFEAGETGNKGFEISICDDDETERAEYFVAELELVTGSVRLARRNRINNNPILGILIRDNDDPEKKPFGYDPDAAPLFRVTTEPAHEDYRLGQKPRVDRPWVATVLFEPWRKIRNNVTVEVWPTGYNGYGLDASKAATPGAGGSCGHGADYRVMRKTVRFAPGERVTKAVSIPLCQDRTPEAEEKLILNWKVTEGTGVSAAAQQGSVPVTILASDQGRIVY